MIDPAKMNRMGYPSGERRGACGCRSDGYARRDGGCDRSHEHSHGCSCRTEGAEACREMKQHLMRLEFAIADTVLYLDAYPECAEALAYYHKLLAERNALRARIMTACGPMTVYENVSEASWSWTDDPWPWNPDAN